MTLKYFLLFPLLLDKADLNQAYLIIENLKTIFFKKIITLVIFSFVSIIFFLLFNDPNLKQPGIFRDFVGDEN